MKIFRSNCHVHLDLSVVSVVDKLEIFELKLLYLLNFAIEFEVGERVRDTPELLFERFNVIRIDVCVAKYVNEFTTLKVTDLG